MHFKSPVIYNGVCVYCIGFINLTKFDGVAKLEFDAQFAQVYSLIVEIAFQQLFSMRRSVQVAG